MDTGQSQLELQTQLSRVPLFAPLTGDELRALASRVRLSEAPEGETIVREGDEADRMYIVLEGQLAVLRAGVDGQVSELAVLGEANIFGEMALVTGEPRNASVVSRTPVRLGAVSREDFERMLSQRPALDDEVRRIVAARLHEAPRRIRGAAVAVLGGPGPIHAGAAVEAGVRVVAPGTAPHHATLRRTLDGWAIDDAGTSIGTLVNREPVTQSPLRDGDTVGLGAGRLYYSGGVLYDATPEDGVTVGAAGVGVEVEGRHILRDVDLRIAPGEFVAIIGASGAGKTTLLNALLGLMPVSSGEVTFDGVRASEDRAALRSILGYVPQYDIVHQELTVAESLGFSAALRLPPGTPTQEVERRVHDLLDRLHLSAQRDTPIAKLSGGQRKRACIAAELLTDPAVLFLDEPAAGLDPGLDAALMSQLRELADEGRTVVITTHATRNIRLCDRVIALSRGRVVFDGAPGEALAHFSADEFAEVYASLGSDPEALVARYRASPACRRQLALQDAIAARESGRGPLTRPSMPGPVRQFGHLVRRNARLLRRDRANIILRVAGAPLLAGMLTGSFASGIFALERADGGNSQQVVILLYLACAITLFLGAFTSANAITMEAGVFRRERLVGLSPTAYVLSKVAVAAVFSALQGFLFIGVLSLKVDFPAPTTTTVLNLGLLLSAVSFAGTTMAMLISSLSANPDRAAILVVLALIPQLVFAGATIPQSEMSPISSAVSRLTITRWALELGGSVSGLEERFAAQSLQSVTLADRDEPVEVEIDYRPYEGAFSVSQGLRWAVLAAFTVLFTAATVVVQTRKGRIRT
ncbi:MAG: ATP-binding cassette domain-containing protein [Dehalococcoidia bacterium]